MAQVQSWMFPLLVIGVIVQFVWSSVVSVVLYRLAKTDRDIGHLEDQLKIATERSIELRFSSISREFGDKFVVINQIRERLERGDGEFRSLMQGDHAVELRLLKEIGQVREQMATRDDLRRMERDLRHGRKPE